MSDIHREQRIQVLLGSQPGSPAQIMGGYLDEGCPTPNPRPASEDEKEELQMYSRGLAHLG